MPDHSNKNTNSATVFFDNFDGPALNTDNWSVIGPSFWVNKEEQAYIDTGETVRILPAGSVEGAEGGVLELRAIYRPEFETPTGRIADFVSGRIESQHKFECTYGRIEARIRMPIANGIWPAFWMLGNGTWPDTGEIDILEYVGEADWVGVALHGPDYYGDTPFVNKHFFGEGTDASDWHVYAVEWDANTIQFFVDDKLIYRATRAMIEHYGEWVFDTPKFLILNLAVGGIYPHKTNGIFEPYFGLPAETAERIKAEDMAIHVDWVRVTQPADVADC